METIVSGIRPTGHLHLGNYFGAVRNFVKLQENNNCYFFVADYHSLTTHPEADDLKEKVKTVIIEFLASGLDPEKATLYIQSDVEEVTELYLLLNMFAYKGELERTASFKEKARKQPNNVNAGLLTYPVLMAADILIHKATKVPVGKDQEQHLEMTRNFAKRFNNFYNTEIFPEPQAYNFGHDLIKVPGLDGSGKMGKSDNNGIYLVDDAKTIKKKIMRAVTDAGPEKDKPMSEGVKNLFTLMELVSDAETVKYFRDQYYNLTIRYGDMKKQLAEDMEKFIAPIRERIKELESDKDYINKILRQGAEKAKESALKTISEVREVIGFYNTLK